MKRFRNIVIWIFTVMLAITNTLPIYAAAEEDFIDEMELEVQKCYKKIIY